MADNPAALKSVEVVVPLVHRAMDATDDAVGVAAQSAVSWVHAEPKQPVFASTKS